MQADGQTSELKNYANIIFLTYPVYVVREIFAGTELALFSTRLVTLVQAVFTDAILIICKVAAYAAPTLSCNTSRIYRIRFTQNPT